MKIYLLCGFVGLYCFATQLEHKSNVSSQYREYTHFDNELFYFGDTTFRYPQDSLNLNGKIDFFYSNRYEERRKITLSELYLTQEYENTKFELGKVIKYWGELEGYNIGDIFNQKNYLFDPFDKSSKLGTYTLNLTKYKQNDSFEIGFVLYPSKIEYPKKWSPYSILPLDYSDDLQSSGSKYNPTTYLQYHFLPSTTLQSDTQIILWSGYDTKRYFLPINQNTLSQYLYKVDKFLLLSNIVYNDMILKFEGSFTKVKEDKNMGDYAQFSFGLENGLYDMGGVDVTLYSEYYRYLYQDDLKIKNVDIGEIYNDDIFLACKINFNNPQETQIKSGFLFDRQSSEKILRMELETRVQDGFVLKGEVLRTFPKEDTLLNNIGFQTTTSVALTYTF